MSLKKISYPKAVVTIKIKPSIKYKLHITQVFIVTKTSIEILSCITIQRLQIKKVPPERIELSTAGLQDKRSATELWRLVNHSCEQFINSCILLRHNSSDFIACFA